MRGGSLLSVMAMMLMAVGCNGLFYQPLRDEFATPARVGLDFERGQFHTSDGETLAMWRIKAKGPRKGSVLQFHGNAENMTTHFLFVSWLAEHGYDVVTFDYRGYGASTGEPDRVGLLRDGAAAIRAMEQDKQAYFVIAQSLGGAVAVPSIALSQTHYLQGLVIDSSFLSYRRVTRKLLGRFWLTWAFQYPLSYLVSDELSPADFVDGVHVPVVVVHDPADPVVDYSEGQALYQALSRAPRVQFWSYRGGGHVSAFGNPEKNRRDDLLHFLADPRGKQHVAQGDTRP